MRKRSLLENVCRKLIVDLDSHKSITKDQVLAFMEELAVEEPKNLSDMPADYRKVNFSLGEVWQYQEWKELSPEQAFFNGSLWGSARLFELMQQKKLHTDQMKLLVSKYKDKYWMFHAIKSYPGILHKELAVKGHISPSRLSQIMDDNDITTLISYRVSGREKYYFLKPQGEELLEKLKTNDRKVLGSYTEPRKAISINNDSTERAYDRMALSAIAMRETPIMRKNVGLDLLLYIFSSKIATKKIVEENEWIQKSNYMKRWEKSHLKNGSEMSLAR